MEARVRYRILTKNGLFKKNAVFMNLHALRPQRRMKELFVICDSLN